MLLALLIPIVLAPLPVLGLLNSNTQSILMKSRGEIRNRDFDEFSWQAYTPQPSGTYEARFDFDPTGWGTLSPDEAGFGLNTSGEKLGYRLSDDDSSAIIWKLSSNNTIVEDFTETGSEDLGMSLEIDVNFITTYASNITSTSPSGSDIWDSPNYITLPIIGTITAENAECESAMNITITTLDAAGITMMFSGVDNVSAPVPLALPANVSVTTDAASSAAWMIFNGEQPVSIAIGTGNVPSPRATLDAVFQYCPD